MKTMEFDRKLYHLREKRVVCENPSALAGDILKQIIEVDKKNMQEITWKSHVNHKTV